MVLGRPSGKATDTKYIPYMSIVFGAPGPARRMDPDAQQMISSSLVVGTSDNISARTPEGDILIIPNRLDRGQIEPVDVAARIAGWGWVQPLSAGAK